LEILVSDLLYTGAGKSVFLLSAVHKVFNDAYITTFGVDVKMNTLEIGNTKVKL
jgi:hypothetical protein